MSSYTALSKTGHASSRFLPRDGWRFAAGVQHVPVLQAELPKLLPHYALAFVPTGDQAAGYQLVAMTSLTTNNLYVTQDGKWLGDYVPAALRGYPLRLLQHNDQQVLCIAEDHLLAQQEPEAGTDGQEEGYPLFKTNGELSTPVSKIFEFLQQCEVDRQRTAVSVAALADAGLIEPWPLELPRGEDDEPLVVKGLYRINEQALHALEPQALHALRGSPLAIAYAQLFASHQIREMLRRAEYLVKINPDPSDAFDLETFFGGEDDELSFG